MISKWCCLGACAWLTVCNSALLDTLPKCSYKDEKCLIELVTDMLNVISKNGFPDLGVPPIDPIDLKNMSIPIVGLLTILLDDGEMTGIKECVINSIHNDMEKGAATVAFTCDLSIKANVRVTDISPLVQNVLGENAMNADGNIEVKLEKLYMKMYIFYHMVKKEDGNIHFKCHLDEFRYDYEIGDLKMTASKIMYGERDISDFVRSFLNENWKFLMSKYGKDIVDVAMAVFYDIFHRFFETIPAKYYFIDDLSAYVKN